MSVGGGGVDRRRIGGARRLALAILWVAFVPAGAEEEVEKKMGSEPLAFTMKRIDGSPEPLEGYRGQVLLVVNVASKCGLTPQYDGLEALYQRFQERGFAVLGFPANDFASQEPGTDAEIAEFCRSTYGVRFPMFSKIHVKGDDIHPLYQVLTGQPEPIGGPVEWNFQKYLIDRRGRVVEKFSPKISPEDPALVARIEALLEAQH